MPLPQKKLIPGILLLLVIAAFAAPPLWWSEGNPPVINANPANNKGPANIGQTKHMAKSALDALYPILPATAAAIEADLVGPGKPIPSWAAPANQAEKDKNHAPLLIGQLKAIADPFYTRLHAAAPNWLEAERIENGTHHPGSIFPWTTETGDDNNKGMANIGQLKAVFSLRFEHDADIDGMPGLWEEASGLDQDDPTDAETDLDDDGLSNLEEFQNGTDPANADTDNDGATDDEEVLQGNEPNDPGNKPVAQWLVLTGNLEVDVVKSRSRTVTIPKGESRLLIVALHSWEYPTYTEETENEFNDLLEWDIRPAGKDPVAGIVDVNSRHTDWDLALVDEVEILGFSPAHIETTAKYSAPGDADLEIEIDLSATNIGDGGYPSTIMVGVLPVEVTDNLVATGVDAMSKTAAASDIGYFEDFWIMAPLQGPPLPNGTAYENQTRIRIGMEEGAHGDLSCENATPDTDPPNNTRQIDLNGAFDDDVRWRGTGGGRFSEETVTLEIGGDATARELPVKVKAMKHRTVKVAVYRVRRPGSRAFPAFDAQQKDNIANQFYKAFSTQLNAWFELDYYDKEIAYDTHGNPADPSATNADGALIVDTAEEAALAASSEFAATDNTHDIKVILIDDIKYSVSNFHAQNIEYKPVGGNWIAGTNVCIVPYGLKVEDLNGQLVLQDPTSTKLGHNMAHEVGHVMLGRGHPDLYENANPINSGGTAPLPSLGLDEHRERLMCSGNNNNAGSFRLVKGEWDKAES